MDIVMHLLMEQGGWWYTEEEYIQIQWVFIENK